MTSRVIPRVLQISLPGGTLYYGAGGRVLEGWTVKADPPPETLQGRTILALLPAWEENLPDAPIGARDQQDDAGTRRQRGPAPGAFSRGTLPYSRTREAQLGHRLLQSLQGIPGVSWARKTLSLCTGPDEERPVLRHGVMASLPGDVSISDVIDLMKRPEVGVMTCFRLMSRNGRLVHQTLDATTLDVLDESDLYQMETPAIYPTMTSPEVSPLFTNTADAVDILKQLGSPEADDVLKIHSSKTGESLSPPRNQFILVEGLDGIGKTTLTTSLAEVLSARLLKTPPECLKHLRPYFDSQSELVRRAFYTIGNDVVSHEISHVTQTAPVVMDRFWPSTAAYAIATECDVIPPAGHWCYTWPRDLIRPHVTLLLVASEEVRNARIARRPEVVTKEEKNLRNDRLFRERLVAAYRMVDPAPVVIDADKSKESVLLSALSAVRQGH